MTLVSVNISTVSYLKWNVCTVTCSSSQILKFCMMIFER